MDAFGDADTLAAAEVFVPLPLRGGVVDVAGLAESVSAVARRHRPAGLVYGSGLEAVPFLLDRLGRHLPVTGNPAAVLAAVQRPEQLQYWLEGGPVAFPDTQTARPDDAAHWLVKPLAGSGGSGVRPAAVVAEPNEVYQRRIHGVSRSALFLADGKRACLLGVHQQWCRPDNSDGGGFLHGGAANRNDLTGAQLERLRALLDALTTRAGLRGLNGVDCIDDGQQLWLLEINARPCASLDLYDAALPGGLFHWHLRAMAGVLPEAPGQVPQRGYRVVYAPHALRVPRAIDWPDWISDRPLPGSRIAAGAPVCTVHAEGGDFDACCRCLAAREQRLLQALREPRRRWWRVLAGGRNRISS
nr:ATP-grasp domain-containing protein [Methylonatrum kenyense]